MSLVLTQEQELLQGTIREFSTGEISPIASKIDSDSKVPEDLFRKLPELGLYGIAIPAEYRGAGADFLSHLLAVEELSKVSGSVGARISFHGVVTEVLKFSPNESLKAALLPKLASGTLAAFSVDPKSTISWKKSDNGNLAIDGSSDYVLNADAAGIFLVLARSKDGTKILASVISEEAGENLVIGEPKKMMGMRGTGTCSISFKGFRISSSSIVFDPASAPDGLERLLIAARISVAAQALGIGQAALDEEVRYANERSQFNTKIGKFYAVQDFLASDGTSLSTARSLTYAVASQPLNDESLKRKSSMAKISASNAAVQSARHSIRVHGGYGFVRDYPVERYLRDARATQIFLESNEVLKAKIAEDLLR